MVKFKTIIDFYRESTDSHLVLTFNSLCSTEFIVFDVGNQLPGWHVCQLQRFAEYDGMLYLWEGDGAPKDFTGSWLYLERTDA